MYTDSVSSGSTLPKHLVIAYSVKSVNLGFSLALSTLGKKSQRQHIEIFFSFFFFFCPVFLQKIGFDISCKLSTICMKCQNLFSGKIKKKYITNLSSAEFAQRVNYSLSSRL